MSADLGPAHLATLELLAATASYSRAAEQLGVTQPALTQRVQALERQVGFPLVHRGAKGVTLTEAGGRLLTQLSGDFARFGRLLTAFVPLSATRVEIGFTLTTEHEVVPQLSAALERNLPDVEARYHRRWTSDLARDVENGQLDLGFARHPHVWGGLRTELVWEDELELWVPFDHRLAGREVIDLGELAGETIAITPHDLSPGVYDVIESACLSAGFVPDLVSPPLLPSHAEPPAIALWLDGIVTLRAKPNETTPVPAGVSRVRLRQHVRLGIHMVSRRDSARPNVDAVRAVMRGVSRPRRGW